MQNVAFILIGLGILTLVGWGWFKSFTESSSHLLIRIAVGVISVGVLVLIAMAIKDRLAKAKTDIFKEIEK